MKDTRGVRALHKGHKKFMDSVKTQNPTLAKQLQNVRYEWYRLKNSATDVDTYDLYIYDEIMPAYMVDWFGSGVSAEGLIAELEGISAKTINVRINSPGGAVFEAIAIYNALVSHSATINVFVDALAASAASVIAMAGDTVTMMVGSQLMIHDAMGIEMGNAAELREYASFLDRQSDNIASIYAARNGASTEDMRALMLAETWMTAQEAVEIGLADSVYTKPKDAPEEEEEEMPPSEEDEDTPPEEDTEDEENEDEDEELENLMNRNHSLVNRGYKFAGRKRAPAPSTKDVDNFVNVLSDFFGGK